MTSTRSTPTTSPRQTAAAAQHEKVMAAVEAYHLEHGASPSVEQLCALLGMPTASVRTSLRALADAGRIRRGKVGDSGAAHSA